MTRKSCYICGDQMDPASKITICGRCAKSYGLTGATDTNESTDDADGVPKASLAHQTTDKMVLKKTYIARTTPRFLPPQLVPMVAEYNQIAHDESPRAEDKEALIYRVWPDYTLRQAVKSGHCHRNLENLDWALFPDRPTKECHVFCAPLSRSGKITVDKQRAHLNGLRFRHRLPAHHLADFGEASLIALILIYESIYGDDSLLADGQRVRTETRYGYMSNARRIILSCREYYGTKELFCRMSDDNNNVVRNDICFAIGIEPVT